MLRESALIDARIRRSSVGADLAVLAGFAVAFRLLAFFGLKRNTHCTDNNACKESLPCSGRLGSLTEQGARLPGACSFRTRRPAAGTRAARRRRACDSPALLTGRAIRSQGRRRNRPRHWRARLATPRARSRCCEAAAKLPKRPSHAAGSFYRFARTPNYHELPARTAVHLKRPHRETADRMPAKRRGEADARALLRKFGRASSTATTARRACGGPAARASRL